MLELSETYSSLDNLHSIWELDADGDLLVDVGDTVIGILEGMPDWIMHLTLLTHLFCFSLNLRFFNRGYSFYCNRINLLMRLPVPFVSFLKRGPLGYAAYSSL